MRLHRPTLEQVRIMLERDAELAETAATQPGPLVPESRAVERIRAQAFRALLADINFAITKAEDF